MLVLEEPPGKGELKFWKPFLEFNPFSSVLFCAMTAPRPTKKIFSESENFENLIWGYILFGLF